MIELIVRAVLTAALIYLFAGALFTIFFLLKGIKKVDYDSHGSSWGFYLIIVPGCIMLWPLLLIKWIQND